MSRKATDWAKKTTGHRNPAQKNVLMVLAAEFNEIWGYAWASYVVLALYAAMSKRNLRRHLKNLETDGYIEIHRQSHHTATKFRLCMEKDFTAPPIPVRTRRRKTSHLQLALEGGSQDDLRGVVDDTPGWELEGTTATPQNPIRGDNGDPSEFNQGGQPGSIRGDNGGKSGGTTRVIRGDNGGNRLCSIHAHQPGTNPVYVNPASDFQNLKIDQDNDLKPLLQPGGNVCPQPGETGGNSGDQQSKSSFSELTTTGVLEPESENIGPGSPDPYEAYRRNIGSLKPILEAMIRAAEERYGSAWIVEAIGIAVSQNSPRWAYVEGILRKWGSEGRGMLSESTDQRHNRSKYLEEFNRRWGRNPWEIPSPEELPIPPPAAPQLNAPEAAEIWRRALEELQANSDKPIFETWLADTRGLSVDDARFVVEVPTPFAIAWLERRMYQKIQKTLEKLMGEVLDIQFQVREQSIIQPQKVVEVQS